MLVHFEQADSNRLDIATGTVLAELTNTEGLSRVTVSRGGMAGWPADERLRALDRLAATGCHLVLVPAPERGVNEYEFGALRHRAA